jgi:hypothetical protein
MINHNAGEGDCSIAWDVANVSMQKKKDGVSAFGDASTSLHQAMEFFAHCLGPQISEQGIFDQLPVMGDGFFGDRVYYTVAPTRTLARYDRRPHHGCPDAMLLIYY